MVVEATEPATLEIVAGTKLAPEDISGRCVAVLGVRNSGKSSTAAVICEELLRIGHPFIVLDIDGEYWGLRERWEVLTAGTGAHTEVTLRPEQTGALAEVVLARRVPVVLDLSEWSKEEGYEAVYRLAEALWKLAGDLRVPCMVIIEEAHEWVPEGVKTDLRELLARIALRGRKRGLGAVIVSQRSAKVAKDVLSQAEVYFCHKVTHPADLSVYKDLVPWPGKQVEQIVPALQPGEAILVRSGGTLQVQVRPRLTFHAGFTPSFAPVPVPPMKAVGEELVAALRAMAATSKAADDPLGRAQHRIRELEAALSEAEKQRDEAEASARALGYIRFEAAPLRLEMVMPDGVPVQFPPAVEGAWSGAPVSTETVQEQPAPLRAASFPRPVQRHLEALAADIRSLPAADRAILKFLAEREPTEYTLRQLAIWLEYRLTSLTNKPPLRVVDLGLVRRVGKGAGARYRADTARCTEERFAPFRPGIGDGEIAAIVELVRKLAVGGGRG